MPSTPPHLLQVPLLPFYGGLFQVVRALTLLCGTERCGSALVVQTLRVICFDLGFLNKGTVTF